MMDDMGRQKFQSEQTIAEEKRKRDEAEAENQENMRL